MNETVLILIAIILGIGGLALIFVVEGIMLNVAKKFEEKENRKWKD